MMSDAPNRSLHVDSDCLAAYSLGMSIKKVQMMIGILVADESGFPLIQATGTMVWRQLKSLARAVEEGRTFASQDKLSDYDRAAKAFLRIERILSGQSPFAHRVRPDPDTYAMLLDAWAKVDELEVVVRSILQTQSESARQWFDLGLEVPDIRKYNLRDIQKVVPEGLAPGSDQPFLAVSDTPMMQQLFWTWTNLAKIMSLFEVLSLNAKDMLDLSGTNGQLPLYWQGDELTNTFHLRVWRNLESRLNALANQPQEEPSEPDYDPAGNTPADATLNESESKCRPCDALQYGYLELATDDSRYLVFRQGYDYEADFSSNPLPWDIFKKLLKSERTPLYNEALYPLWDYYPGTATDDPTEKHVNDSVAKINKLLKPLGIRVKTRRPNLGRTLEEMPSS